ncbi:MAG: hypothetical protein ACKO96_37975, partial [Flammeovirgaceae bacterium]
SAGKSVQIDQQPKGDKWKKCIEIHMATAIPSRQKQLLFDELRATVTESLGNVIKEIAEGFVEQDNGNILVLIQDPTQLYIKSVGTAFHSLRSVEQGFMGEHLHLKTLRHRYRKVLSPIGGA